MKIEIDFSVGDVVWDDLTQSCAKIIGITFETGKVRGDQLRTACDCVGYWLDNDHMSGGRHPWEITKI